MQLMPSIPEIAFALLLHIFKFHLRIVVNNKLTKTPFHHL
jgi:hypothetical protein